MPVDFSAWLPDQDISIVTFGKDIAPGAPNLVQKVGGLQNKILDVLRTNFPAQLAAGSARVTKDIPDEYSTKAEYGGLAGDVIKAGKLSGDTYQRVNTTTGKKSSEEDLSYTGSGKTTDNVFTMLHEIYHNRSYAAPNYSQKIGNNWQKLLEDASNAGFPSVDRGVGGGDRLNELLASAVTLQDMQKKGMKFDPDSKYRNLPAALDKLKQTYPWMQDWLNTYERPELLTTK